LAQIKFTLLATVFTLTVEQELPTFIAAWAGLENAVATRAKTKTIDICFFMEKCYAMGLVLSAPAL
jgi:hypothetical protein